jgi:nitrilase
MTMKATNSLSVAVLQMVSSASLAENLKQAEGLIKKAAAQKAKLMLLPENFSMFSASSFLQVAEQEEKEQLLDRFLSKHAKEFSCYLVAGSLPVLCESQASQKKQSEKNQKVYSCTWVYSPEGKRIAEYNKVHLFDVDVDDNVGAYRESENIESGKDVVSFEIDGIKIGLSICYDLRFPELYRELSSQGCQVLLVPAAFTYATGEKHWQVLLRARAIENQCYVLAANQGGEHRSKSGQLRKTYGHTMIVDADGVVLAELEAGAGVLVKELNFSAVESIRKKMPVLTHRKL